MRSKYLGRKVQETRNVQKLAKIMTAKSSIRTPWMAMGFAAEEMPSISKMLKMLEPMTLPKASS